MRVLHLTKTADGAGWAAAQAAELVKLGVEVHVALPSAHGRTVQKWADGGALVHIVPTDMPMGRPWAVPAAISRLRALVSSVRPDIIHSHFLRSTVLLRLALGPNHTTPRVYQVAGPLHLEYRFWRSLELSIAGPSDHWIASSRCVMAHCRAAGVPEERLHLSYYGMSDNAGPTARTGLLRRRYGIADHMKVVGNANFIYPPKWYLGQRIGPKAHEDVIDALGLIIRHRSDVIGVLIGGTFAGSRRYEGSLRSRANAAGGGRIIMTGYLPSEEIRRMWPDFDVAVHVPTSENCGGVGEPLLAAVPTIAARVGGLPEVVVDGITGKVVGIHDPQELAQAVLSILENQEHYCGLARVGRELVRTMFDVQRTAREVYGIYRHILDVRYPRPTEFDSLAYLREVVGPPSSNVHSVSESQESCQISESSS